LTLTPTRHETPSHDTATLLIEEARHHHRVRIVRTGLIALSVAAGALALLYFAGPVRAHTAQRPPPPRGAAPGGRPRVGFVLVPKWLPSSFSATGGDSVDPPGGLRLGSHPGHRYSASSSNAAGSDPTVLYTLDYYGYHDPESKSIHLEALRGGHVPSGKASEVGDRSVVLTSQFDPIGFAGTTVSRASWRERGVTFDVIASGIDRNALAHFVAALREQPPPPERRIPEEPTGTGQVAACASLRRDGFRCVAQIIARRSGDAVGTVVGTSPAGGSAAAVGSYVTLVVASDGAISGIPSVLGASLSQARETLQRDGFVPEASCQLGHGAGQSDRVMRQSPAPGSLAVQGSLVQVTLGRAEC